MVNPELKDVKVDDRFLTRNYKAKPQHPNIEAIKKWTPTKVKNKIRKGEFIIAEAPQSFRSKAYPRCKLVYEVVPNEENGEENV